MRKVSKFKLGLVALAFLVIPSIAVGTLCFLFQPPLWVAALLGTSLGIFLGNLGVKIIIQGVESNNDRNRRSNQRGQGRSHCRP